MNNTTKITIPQSLELDHSSKLYPLIANSVFQSIFCVGAELREIVDLDILKKVLVKLPERFPFFTAYLHSGKTCHHWKISDAPVEINEYDDIPVKRFDLKAKGKHFFRVSTKANKLFIDVFHGLCDGTGAIEILKCILKQYAKLKGQNVEHISSILNMDDSPKPEEYEDSFDTCYDKYPTALSSHAETKPKIRIRDLARLIGKSKPHLFKGKILDVEKYNSCEFSVDLEEVKVNAKQNGLSITTYLSSIVAKTISAEMTKNRNLVMLIPANMRPYFEAKTLRNFVTLCRINLTKQTCLNQTECGNEIHKQLKEKLNLNSMQRFVTSTYKLQNLKAYKNSSIAFKKFIINSGRNFLGPRQTIILSNLGVLELPEELGVSKIFVQTNISQVNPQNVGILTQHGRIYFYITRAIESDFADNLITNLEDNGHRVSEVAYLNYSKKNNNLINLNQIKTSIIT